MRILITGGLGFIGSYFAEILASDPKNNITILDNYSGFSKSAEALLNSSKYKNITIFKCDIANDEINSYFNEINFVYHFAANSKISEGVNNPDVDFNVTAMGTHKVLSAMVKNNVKNIVFPSGSGVYGDQDETILAEDFGPLLPVSFYGASKLCAEAYISSFVAMKNIKAYIFRFANVVGKRQTHGVAYDFYYKLKENPNKLEILGNGHQSKSYIDVDDIFNAIQFTIHNQQSELDVYNIATSDYISVRDIARVIVEEMGLDNVEMQFGESAAGWLGDVPIVRFSTNKINNLGWSPSFNSEQATRRAIKEIIKNDNN